MNKINYQRELDQTLAEITAKGEVPTLLLHSCCAPCSSYVLSYLASYFRITLYYYNPEHFTERRISKTRAGANASDTRAAGTLSDLF